MLTPFCCNKPGACPRGQILWAPCRDPYGTTRQSGVDFQECTEVTYTPPRKCVWVVLVVCSPHSCFLLKDASLWNISHEARPFLSAQLLCPTHSITRLSWNTMESHYKLPRGWDWSQMCLQLGWSSTSAPRKICLENSVQQTPEALLLPWQLFIDFLIKCSLVRSSMSQHSWLNRGFVCQRALIWLSGRKVKAKIGT